jgi:hypothetical protein
MRRFALCPTTAHLAELGVTPVLLGRVESTMANQAEEARARLEERFRKQYEADRTAEKDRAERDTQVGRERSKPTTRDGSADPKGGRQGGWD